MEFEYRTEKELELLVDKEVEYLWGSSKLTGMLKQEKLKNGSKYWLPLCGGVNALTVKVKM